MLQEPWSPSQSAPVGYLRAVPDHGDLIEFYRSYGASSFADDEPGYAEVCEHLGDHPELVELIAGHDPDAQQPNLLFAAVHYLLLGGLDHPLRYIYDGTSSLPVAPVFADAVLSNRSAIDELLRNEHTQTNEVGRSAVLALMLNDAHQRSQQALAWIDLGASGGLNLNIDQFRIDYTMGESCIATGPADAALTLRCDVRSGAPAISSAHATIAWRVGVDRSPIQVADPDRARWLQACLWPSQPERHARMAAAIAIAQAHPQRIIGADAVDGVAQALAEAPADTALVITTTWVWYYLPEATKQAVLGLLRNSGRRVRWYSLEGRGLVAELGQPTEREVIDSLIGRVELGGGTPDTSEVLGLSHPHGAWLDWYAGT
jgi:hypothetical protein